MPLALAGMRKRQAVVFFGEEIFVLTDARSLLSL
jgi:hypothetical protein